MRFSHALRIERSYGNERAKRLLRSLIPEQEPLADARSTARLVREGDRLIIEIEAADLVALRAATNTWFGLLETAESVHDDAAGY